MSFLSKIYFKTFKKQGNLRLMFVASCVFALCCFFFVRFESQHRVYRIDINSVSLEQVLDVYLVDRFKPGTDLSRYVIKYIEQNGGDVSVVTNSVVVKKYCLSGRRAEAYKFAKKKFSNVGVKKDFSTGEALCASAVETPFSIISSYGYLWNFLWVIFWFYFPFILVLPVKFVCDGYHQDRM